MHSRAMREVGLEQSGSGEFVCFGLFDSKTALELKIWLFFLPW